MLLVCNYALLCNYGYCYVTMNCYVIWYVTSMFCKFEVMSHRVVFHLSCVHVFACVWVCVCTCVHV